MKRMNEKIKRNILQKLQNSSKNPISKQFEKSTRLILKENFECKIYLGKAQEAK